jgi:hypothetical protein
LSWSPCLENCGWARGGTSCFFGSQRPEGETSDGEGRKDGVGVGQEVVRGKEVQVHPSGERSPGRASRKLKGGRIKSHEL